jgi:hypothetical protein
VYDKDDDDMEDVIGVFDESTIESKLNCVLEEYPCLVIVNNSVYVALYMNADDGIDSDTVDAFDNNEDSVISEGDTNSHWYVVWDVRPMLNEPSNTYTALDDDDGDDDDAHTYEGADTIAVWLM